jgi:glycosyltransferase involved in cell wall biosynthesis
MKNQRIAVVVFSSYPFDSRVRREAETLYEAGMEVDVICVQMNGQAKKELVNGITVNRVNVNRSRTNKFSYLKEYALFIFTAFFKLTLHHLKRKYQTVHIHNMPDILVISALIPKLFGAKIVLDIHDIMPEFYMRKYQVLEKHKMILLLKLLEKLSVKFSNYVITASPFFRDKLVKRSANSDRCEVIYNLPDIGNSHNKFKINHNNNGKFKIIYPGTISEIHGVDIAIKAIKLAKEDSKYPIELHIYGLGPKDECDRLHELKKRLNLEENVFFHDIVPTEQLKTILQTMDVGLVPKKGGVFAEDAISTKLFEFAMAGLPAVVSKTKSDQIFFDDSMVMFFEPENERQLADCILKLKDDPYLRKSLSIKANSIFKTVNWDNHKIEFVNIFKKL